MHRTLVVGLGRSGVGLHHPVLLRVRQLESARHLFARQPVIGFDPRGGPPGGLSDTVLVPSLAHALELTDPGTTVVHLCTPPTERVNVLDQLARLGFRKIIVEKPLAMDEDGLAAIARLRERWNLDLVVVAQWLDSVLTARIRQVLDDGRYGRPRSISMIAEKPRFTRSLTTHGHPTAFDVEIPHSLGLVVNLAGDATVQDAGWADLVAEDVVIPRLGQAWMVLGHDSGVRSELRSDLMSPSRERRITVEFDHAVLCGHYPVSDADDYAQLITLAGGRYSRSAFPDDSLGAFMLRAYRHFAGPGCGPRRWHEDASVVRLLAQAKRICATTLVPAS